MLTFHDMRGGWREHVARVGVALVALIALASVAQAQAPAKAGAKAAAPAPASAPASAAKPAGDEEAIRATASAYTKAFNAGDAKALAATWAVDGHLVDERGREFVGREEIEKEFTEIFEQEPGAKIEVSVGSVRLLSPDVAVEVGTATGKAADGTIGPPVKYTAVHVKRDGKWQLSNVSESQTGGRGNSQLASLGWLVGQWKATLGDDKQVYRLSCQWMPEKTFLSRTFTVTSGDRTITSGTQIIGWDPITEQIVSWTFDSSGGFGHETWGLEGSQWRIDASSVMPKIGTSLATNLLNKINDNTFTWRSVDRSLNDQLLPDTAEVRVERVAP